MLDKLAESLWQAESLRASDRPRKEDWNKVSDLDKQRYRFLITYILNAMFNPEKQVLEASNCECATNIESRHLEYVKYDWNRMIKSIIDEYKEVM